MSDVSNVLYDCVLAYDGRWELLYSVNIHVTMYAAGMRA